MAGASAVCLIAGVGFYTGGSMTDQSDNPKTQTSLTVEIEVSLGRISDLLCSALEGGSNYWYTIETYTEPTSVDFHTKGEGIFPHLDYPLNPGGALTIGTLDGDEFNGQKSWKLDLSAVRKGLALMAAKYPHHFADMLDESGDATTGDVFLQCCLFGEVEYS
jgi:hypothetical protein